ncbi:RHS repeat-associated core domain-containing protein [Saccharibacillus sp. JS10]|uniref:RHS repeat-associated core domain-containing protein n=1 Tax=Saccharibacillus sp. JS10 TaxID=2950552 RepID=UPI0021090C8E|nr:RHS repeat-associated core domain-containing protein [Saccharibacillus sp. JS10]MCQ4087552.1 hypothetical protein [Saccharibacillus sp. JS10]
MYDNNSNITGGTTRGGINVVNQYDEQNRLASWSSGDKNGSFTYYKNGLRKSMTDETGTTQYFYTLDNLLERMVYPDGKEISYTYYKNGLPNTMTDPFGLTTTYIYNADNQLSEVRTENTKQAEYIYRDGLVESDENHLKSSQLYQLKLGDNGQITTTYTNDGFGRLTKLLQSAGGLTQAFTYGYDNGDNITSRSDGTTSGTFSYDELDRIITSSEGDETYTYDGKGNRLTLQSSIQMPHKDNIDYTYNQAEQLSGVTRNQTSVSYKYNGDGLMTERSITKDGQSTTTRYYYDGANIIAEGKVAADGTVTFKARYVRGAQLIYREDANHEKAYYQHNGHGDVTGLVKADGTVLNRYTYDIWGNPLTSDVQVENVFGYSGEYWDEDTGLQYLRSRWYDPSIGRFIQEDTFEGRINRPSSLNLYTYVENNPLKYTDPTGHEFRQGSGGGGGGGGGAKITPSSPSTGSRSSAPKSKSTTRTDNRTTIREQNTANKPNAVPPMVQSRINIRNGSSDKTSSGLNYALKGHKNVAKTNKSQFTVSNEELTKVLQSPKVVNTPAVYQPLSKNYARKVVLDKGVGNLASDYGGAPTRFLTVFTDKFGNLMNTFPGGSTLRGGE